MTAGDKTYVGLAVPLNGESEIKQITAATDILTITGAASQTGKFLVCRNSSGTEKFAVSKYGLNLGSAITAKPTTGLTKGDVFMFFSNSSPQLAVCTSTAGQTVKFISPFDTKTIGRAT